jgi:hypothetical protein
MGLLDDAIREHLELKRRHGADPQEVARQEDEALGPIGGHDPHPEHDEDGHDHEPVEVHEDQLALVDEPPVPYEEPAAAEHHRGEPDPPHVAEELAEAPAFDLQQPTVEFSVEDEHAGEPAPAPPEDAEPADELEETPEFLQETPEHDRLWFEQKPPRDFDF